MISTNLTIKRNLKKVLLLIPNVYAFQKIRRSFRRISEEPLYLQGICAAFANAGKEVRVLDAFNKDLTLDDTHTLIKNYDPDLIGVTTYERENSREAVIATMKAFPRLQWLLGGPDITHTPTSLSHVYAKAIHDDFSFAPIAVRGEGEDGVRFLLETDFQPEQGKYEDGKILVENEKYLPFRLITNLHPYDINKLPLERKWWKLDDYRVAVVNFSRGCVGLCNFCGGSFPKKIRYLTPERSREEVKYLKGKGVSQFKALTPDLASKPKNASDIIDAINPFLKNTYWQQIMRIDSAYEAFIKYPDPWRILASNNLIWTELGYETGVPSRLMRLEKCKDSIAFRYFAMSRKVIGFDSRILFLLDNIWGVPAELENRKGISGQVVTPKQDAAEHLAEAFLLASLLSEFPDQLVLPEYIFGFYDVMDSSRVRRSQSVPRNWRKNVKHPVLSELFRYIRSTEFRTLGRIIKRKFNGNFNTYGERGQAQLRVVKDVINLFKKKLQTSGEEDVIAQARSIANKVRQQSI